MRVVGKRMEGLPGLRWPTLDEVRRTEEFGRGVLLYRRPGISRYRNHDEANADMVGLTADAMARKALRLVRREG